MRYLVLALSLTVLAAACTDGRTTVSQASAEHVADCLCACPVAYTVSAYCGPGETMVDHGCGNTAGSTLTSETPMTGGTLQGVTCGATPDGPNGAARAWAACQPAE